MKIHLFASLARKNLEILVYDEITELCKPKVGVARLVSSPKVGGARNADSAHLF